MSNEIEKSVVNGISEFIANFGNKAFMPLAQFIGTSLDFANLQINFWHEKKKYNFEKRLEEYKNKVDNIAKEKRVQVIPEIGVPILTKLQYITNDEVSDLFTTLLASASSKDTEEFAHPSFINVISRISSDEARIIKYLKSLENKEIPYLKYKLLYSSNTFDYLQEYTTLIKEKVELSYENNECLYFENLINLGVLKDGFDLKQSSDIEYMRIDNYYGEKYKKSIYMPHIRIWNMLNHFYM